MSDNEWKCPACGGDPTMPWVADCCLEVPSGLLVIHRDDAFETHDETGMLRHKATGTILGGATYQGRLD